MAERAVRDAPFDGNDLGGGGAAKPALAPAHAASRYGFRAVGFRRAELSADRPAQLAGGDVLAPDRPRRCRRGRGRARAATQTKFGRDLFWNRSSARRSADVGCRGEASLPISASTALAARMPDNLGRDRATDLRPIARYRHLGHSDLRRRERGTIAGMSDRSADRSRRVRTAGFRNAGQSRTRRRRTTACASSLTDRGRSLPPHVRSRRKHRA